MKKGDIIPVKIEKFALGGQGLAFLELPALMGEDAPATRKIPIFVDDVCVGDEVEMRLVKKKGSFGEGKLQKITKPSDERVVPRCAHFGVCGGCSWQFLPYEQQLAWKEQLVRETLQHVGGFSEETLGTVFSGITGCDDPWFYRNKMEWSFSVGTDGALSGGFHMRHMHYDTVNVRECFLQSSTSVKIFTKIREYFTRLHEEGVKISYNSKTHRGLIHSVYVREGKRTGEYMVIAQTTPEEFDEVAFLEILKIFPEIVSVVRIVVHEMKGTPKRFEEKIMHGVDFYREELWITEHAVSEPLMSEPLRLQFRVRPQAFFQPNTLMAEKIYAQCLALLREHFSAEELGRVRLYDLYCGTGTIGLALSHAVKSVVGVELNASAIESARENASLNGMHNIEFFVGDVKKILGELETTHAADVIVVDPPRCGLEERVVEYIVASAPRAILYVSCNPATFARDAKLFVSRGFAMKFLRAFDQFPQTAHIETVALFLKA